MRFFLKLFQGGLEQNCGPTRLIDLSTELPYERLNYHSNRAYFCKGCGKLWAQWLLEEQEPLAFNWYCFHSTCGDHQQGAWEGDTPGSMLLYNTDILVVPRSVLEAELLRLTDANHNPEPIGTDVILTDENPGYLDLPGGVVWGPGKMI